jgi:hypothetical protein
MTLLAGQDRILLRRAVAVRVGLGRAEADLQVVELVVAAARRLGSRALAKCRRVERRVLAPLRIKECAARCVVLRHRLLAARNIVATTARDQEHQHQFAHPPTVTRSRRWSQA